MRSPMNHLVVAAALALTCSCAIAGPRRPKAAADQAPKCPAGGSYRLQTKPSKEHTVAAKINGKTYYVCEHCARGLKAAAAKKSAANKAKTARSAKHSTDKKGARVKRSTAPRP